jgi:hypothetical protein
VKNPKPEQQGGNVKDTPVNVTKESTPGPVSRVLSLLLIFISLMPMLGNAQVREVTVPDLVHSANLVVRGTVIRSECRWADFDFGRIIVTDFTLRVTTLFKGTTDDSTVVVEVFGGIVGDVGLAVDNVPKFSIGDDAIVFLSPADDLHRRRVVRGACGKYTVDGLRIAETGQPVSDLLAHVAREAGQKRSKP